LEVLYKMDKNKLIKYLKQGMTQREIAKQDDIKIKKSTVGYWINKYNLNHLMKYQKPTYNSHYFSKVDTKEKAYILGFILADSHIDKDYISLKIALSDKKVLYFISEQLGGNVYEHNKLNKSKRIFPHVRLKIGDKNIYTDIRRYIGGRLKKDRHFPIISDNLRCYLLQGFFDGDGSIMYGQRKDRNRMWQKVSFTSPYKILSGVQNVLLNHDIPTKIHPKSNEDTFVLEFADQDRIKRFIELIYPNNEYIILKRKHKKANALRLKLG